MRSFIWGARGILWVRCPLTGVAPVDPFIMGLTLTAGKTASVDLAAGAVVVAAASNNKPKSIDRVFFADSKTGRQSLILLLALTALGLLHAALDRPVGGRAWTR